MEATSYLFKSNSFIINKSNSIKLSKDEAHEARQRQKAQVSCKLAAEKDVPSTRHLIIKLSIECLS